MPLADYLTEAGVVLLTASSRDGALAELAAATGGTGGLEAAEILAAVTARERELSTCISPGVALPHARLAGLSDCVITVGVSAAGVEWVPGEPAVHLVVMLLGATSRPEDHIRALAEIARVVRNDRVVREVTQAATPAEAYGLLWRAQRGGPPKPDGRTEQLNRSILAHALELAGEVRASAVVVHADEEVDLSFVESVASSVRLLLASSHLRRHAAFHERFGGMFEVPFTGATGEHALECALLLAMSEGLIESHDSVICLWGHRRPGLLDSFTIVNVAERFELLLSLRSELSTGGVDHHVLNRVIGVASSLGREGREGKPVGTLFVVGAYEQVAPHLRQMVVNPFKGYDEGVRSILDPSLEETIKEFSLIDGAFVVRGDGVVMSAGTYLTATAEDVDMPPGLGSRHAAAAGITRVTGAVAVAVSESTGTVTLYAAGRAILKLPR